MGCAAQQNKDSFPINGEARQKTQTGELHRRAQYLFAQRQIGKWPGGLNPLLLEYASPLPLRASAEEFQPPQRIPKPAAFNQGGVASMQMHHKP